MNEEEQIKQIVTELNRTKYDIVTPIKDFVTYGKNIVSHTDKRQDESGKIVTVVQNTVELTKIRPSDIPDLIGGGSLPSLNTVEIISPVAKNSPYTKLPIDIEFKASGPHHDASKEYVYIIIITDSNGKIATDLSGTKMFNNRGSTKISHIVHGYKLNLLDGQYTIQITTADPDTKKILAQSKKETFVVGTGGGPTPIINNIIINNNIVNVGGIVYNVTLPFVMPLDVKFQLADPRYINYFINMPLNISIKVTEDSTGNLIFSKEDTFMGIEYVLKEGGKNSGIPFISIGKYNMLIVIMLNGKELFKKVVPVTIKPKTSRKGAIFTLHIDGTEGPDGEKFKSNISMSSGKPVVFEIENSGGGILTYDIAVKDDFLDVKTEPVKKSLSAGKVARVIVSLDVRKLKIGQRTASLVVTGTAGKTRKLAESWIYLNIVD
ncbi:MAG: hypothetical protein ACP5OA_00925 [Candidatus Woesearchaeota archaeon]